MNNFETQIRDIAQKEALDATAKAHMRERVLQYAAYKPLRTKAQRQERAVPAWRVLFAQRATVATLLFAFVVGGAGTTYAAEGALPGDVLYGVKEFTEAAREQLAVSQESRIAWNIERAHRRLFEAAALAAQARLTPERDEYLAQQFEALATQTETAIVKTQTTNEPLATALELDFTLGVAAHAHALDKAPTQKTKRVIAVAKRIAQRAQNRAAKITPPPVPAVAPVAAFEAPAPAVAEQASAPLPPTPAVVREPEPSTTASATTEDALAPLQRAAERRAKQLEQSQMRVRKPEAREDIRATIQAISEVKKALPKDALPVEKRAFLEAAIQEVHETRVRTLVPQRTERTERTNRTEHIKRYKQLQDDLAN